MKSRPTTEKLTLKRETLRVLTPADLRLVAGGRPSTNYTKPTANNCTGRLSGCIS